MKYWFIAYNSIEAVIGEGIRTLLFNTLTDIHPFEWLENMKNKGEVVIRIEWFTEITKEQFEKYKDIIN